MARTKAKDRAHLYSHTVRTRVTPAAYARLEAFVGKGDCHSIGEVARRVLSQEKILYVLKDGTMDATMEELTAIRKELNAIGTNINQLTRQFHTATTADQRLYFALKVADQYQTVGDRVDLLLQHVATLSLKWLQK